MDKVFAGYVDDFEDSIPEEVDHNGKLILVVKVDDSFYAVDAVCTHQEVNLVDGKVLKIGGCPQLVCPAHLGRFDLCTGKAVYKPPKEPLSKYDVIIEEDQVFVLIP